MQVLQRLKMELSNQEYFTDEQYIQFLVENDLTYTDEYVKADMQRNLLYAVLDVLEAVTNDIDLMTGISTEFNDIGNKSLIICIQMNKINFIFLQKT